MLKLLLYLNPYRKIVIIGLTLIFISVITELLLPRLTASVINEGIVKGNIDYMLKVGGVMLVLALIGGSAIIGASYFSAKASAGFGKTLRSKVFSHVEKFSLGEVDKIGTASIITRVTNDINQVQQVLLLALRMMVRAPMMCVGGIIMAVSTDLKLSGIIIAVIPILIIIIAFLATKAMKHYKELQLKIDKINRVMRDSLSGIRVIRAFNRNEYDKKQFDDVNTEYMNISLKVNRLMAIAMPLMLIIMNFTILIVVILGTMKVDDPSIPMAELSQFMGNLMAFIEYIIMILFAIIMLSMMFVMVPRAIASFVRINEILDTPIEIKDREDAIKYTSCFGKVEFKDVSFKYEGAENDALSNISFVANPGEITAIIGGTGSGKTTLINLLMRLYEKEKGRILIDDKDIMSFTQESLRELVGYVPQKANLFSGTIEENIKFAKEDASMEEVKHAASISQSLKFILEIKEGFKHVVTQGGTNLSGGQKQRLCIARALIKNPCIYFLDDSFSALDFKTDAMLRKSLKVETKEKTMIVVAQRVSTVLDADRIIVLEDGLIVGNGKHEELYSKCKVYREIVDSQLSKEELG